MSYCRWSSDGYQCDVYCYQSDAGFETHVASRRTVERIPEIDWAGHAARFSASLVAHREALDRRDLQPIGLEHDGETFVDATEAEMFARLRHLQGVGYQIPEWVFPTTSPSTPAGEPQ